jgi:hypothetical protein
LWAYRTVIWNCASNFCWKETSCSLIVCTLRFIICSVYFQIEKFSFHCSVFVLMYTTFTF